MTIQGLHHITLVTAAAQRNVDFYTHVLGLRLVKQTVNFDDPSSYHLYFGDELGRPGTAITFFEWPGVPRGQPGVGGTAHFALETPSADGLRQWHRRLRDLGVPTRGPIQEGDATALYFHDPDGTALQLVTQAPFTALLDADWPVPVPTITPEMALRRGMHHITAISSNLERTHTFLHDLLGLTRTQVTADTLDAGAAQWHYAVPGGRLTLVYQAAGRLHTRPARMGAGQTHHFALAVPDESTQLAWREKLLSAGLRVSPVMDRIYFKSIYTRDPDGHIVELATAGPGFTVDEAPATLGTRLCLPPWLEAQRTEITHALRPLTVPTWTPVVESDPV